MNKKKILKKIKYALRFLPDSIYIQIYYFAHYKRFCNLKEPRTFNEKLNWLKLHDRNPDYIKMVDKYEVKNMLQILLARNILFQLLEFGIISMILILTLCQSSLYLNARTTLKD